MNPVNKEAPRASVGRVLTRENTEGTEKNNAD
jgi:hypothetical protein